MRIYHGDIVVNATKLQPESDLPPLPHPRNESELYLRGRIEYWLTRARHEEDVEKRKGMLEYAFELITDFLRASQGTGGWAPVLFATIVCMIVATVLVLVVPQTQVFQVPHISVRVLRQYNEYDFMLQKVVDGVPELPSSWHFCHDFKPRFEIGFTLTRLVFYQKDMCTEIKPFEPAYNILRGNDDMPIIPANCHNAVGRRCYCDGPPHFI